MGSKLSKLGKYLGTPLILGGGAAYLGAKHPEVYQAAGEVIGAVDGVLSGIYESTIDALKNVLYVGEAAPFAFPVIAGGSLGYKLADALKLEKKILRHSFGILGAGAGFAASKSVLAPYLGLYGMYKSGKFIYERQIVQRVVKGVINPLFKVTEASKKLLVDTFISAKRGLIDNQLEKPVYAYARA